ncbi:MAG: DUF748 domain-containing protein [Acidobacteriota bacterium]
MSANPKPPSRTAAPRVRSPRGKKKTGRRLAIWAAGTLVGIFVLLLVLPLLVEEPMRRSMERRMNASLKGYSVKLSKLHLRPLGLGLTLENLTVRQNANPEPPVAVFPRLQATVQFRELLALRLVADFLLDRPVLYVNLAQLRSEASDATPVKEHGWQQAVEQIYPLKINLFRVENGEVTYVDEDPNRPLHLTHLQLRANNIRNFHSKDRTYPSPVHAEAVVFDSGRAQMDGHADFLAEPFVGIHVLLNLQRIPIDYFKPMIARANLSIQNGILNMAGEIEYAPGIRLAHLSDLKIEHMRLDYIHTAATAPAEAQRREMVSRAAKQASRDPGTLLQIDRLALENCDVGLVNKAKPPGFRVFLSPVNVHMENLSSGFRSGPAKARLDGKFMGSGRTTASATFRSDAAGPDFDLKGAIEGTPMPAMNDLFRSYGKFDVVGGVFSFYTELTVAKGGIRGYVKPLFKDMKVYDQRQDAEKSLFRKLYEQLVGGVANLLENRRQEVATKADISGPIERPGSSTWQVIARLIENAFFRAILPGFDHELAHPQRS